MQISLVLNILHTCYCGIFLFLRQGLIVSGLDLNYLAQNYLKLLILLFLPLECGYYRCVDATMHSFRFVLFFQHGEISNPGLPTS